MTSRSICKLDANFSYMGHHTEGVCNQCPLGSINILFTYQKFFSSHEQFQDNITELHLVSHQGSSLQDSPARVRERFQDSQKAGRGAIKELIQQPLRDRPWPYHLDMRKKTRIARRQRLLLPTSLVLREVRAKLGRR